MAKTKKTTEPVDSPAALAVVEEGEAAKTEKRGGKSLEKARDRRPAHPTGEDIPALELEGPSADPGPSTLEDIPLDQIEEIENIRPELEGVEELAASMHAQGQLEPVLVRPAREGADHGRPFELVYGYRRMTAARLLGWDAIRAEIRQVEDEHLLELMITENLQREALEGLTEARVIRAMIEYGNMTQAEVARKLGKAPSHISHRLRLLELDTAIQQRLERGDISASAAEVIASLPSAEDQEKLTSLITRNDWGVRKAQRWARERKAMHENEEQPALASAEQQQPEDDPLAAQGMVLPEDVVALPTLAIRADLRDEDYNRIDLYALLRNGMDMEMLEYLEYAMGTPYDSLWDYIRALSTEQVEVLRRRMLLRYISAAHRYPSLEYSLREDLGAADEQQALPAAEYAAEGAPDIWAETDDPTLGGGDGW